jgi:hypothetical protein
MAEANTADYTAVNEVVHKFNIEDPSNIRIVHSIPVWAFALEMSGQLLWI